MRPAEMRKPAGQGELREDIQSSNGNQHKAKALSPQQRWRQRNPVAYWCHLATASALKRGIIERQVCEICGDPKTDAHHESHLEPLRIRWTCRRHHKQLERELKLSLKCERV